MALHFMCAGCSSPTSAAAPVKNMVAPAAGGVHIPFHIKGHMIAFPAKLNGRALECWLDIGQSYISWPETLGLKGGETGNSNDTWAGGMSPTVRHVTLSEIQIGGVTLPDTPTRAIPLTATEREMIKRTADETDALSLTKPIIGIDAFRKWILTIDYRGNELILERPEDRKLADKSIGFADQLLDFVYDEGCPVVLGTLDGHAARIQIDSGCDEMMVSEDFRNKYLSNSELRKDTFWSGLGTRQKISVCSPEVGIGKAKIKGLDGWVVEVASAADARVGYAALRAFRVTFDFPNQKVLFHVYAAEGKFH